MLQKFQFATSTFVLASTYPCLYRDEFVLVAHCTFSHPSKKENKSWYLIAVGWFVWQVSKYNPVSFLIISTSQCKKTDVIAPVFTESWKFRAWWLSELNARSCWVWSELLKFDASEIGAKWRRSVSYLALMCHWHWMDLACAAWCKTWIIW